ncbi:MAG: cytochrome c-type biogenesis protein [Halioglobus sp.]
MLTFVLLWLVSPLALAVIETYEFSSSDLEARYQQMSAELRCPKCQNQNIADSNAPIAQDLRKLLHQQLEAGASNDEIKQFMVSRYGEFVLYRPRFSGATAVLWLAPALLFICAALVVFVSLRRRGRSLPDSALSEADKKRLQGLVGNTEKGS